MTPIYAPQPPPSNLLGWCFVGYFNGCVRKDNILPKLDCQNGSSAQCLSEASWLEKLLGVGAPLQLCSLSRTVQPVWHCSKFSNPPNFTTDINLLFFSIFLHSFSEKHSWWTDHKILMRPQIYKCHVCCITIIGQYGGIIDKLIVQCHLHTFSLFS